MLDSLLQKVRRLLRSRWSRGREIDPSEILVDASNLPKYNTARLEGRLEHPITSRTLLVLGLVCTLFGSALLLRITELQVVHGDEYQTRSEDNHLHHSIIFAERGVIKDRNGVELAWNVPFGSEAATGTPQEYSARKYTSLPGFGHILGYVSLPKKDSSGFFYKTSIEGLSGVEKTYDMLLAGEQGAKIVETDAHLHVVSESRENEPKNGETLTLSIDARLQEALHRYLGELVEKVPFVGGAGVLMDVQSGEILALVSYPEFSPQSVTDGDAQALAAYQQDPRKPFIDRVVGGLYAPGSIIKPFLAIGALTEGIITPTDIIVSTGALTVPNPYHPDQPSVFRDWKALGPMDMRHAIAYSSDVYFYEVGGGFGAQKGLGISRVEKYARMFGFGAETGIMLSGEQTGVIPNPEWKAKNFDGEPWRVGDTYLTSIGQYGFQVTPLQAVRAVAAIANGGTIRTPRLTAVPDGANASPLRRVDAPASAFKVVKEGMRLSAQEGTASGLNTPYVAIAAKTGTAELGVQKHFVNSWVIGFFPYEQPRYAFAILLDRGPKGNTLGGVYVMRQLLDWMHTHTPEYFSLTPIAPNTREQ